MVYRMAGILLVAAGVASVVAPTLVAQWENRRQGNRDAPITEGRTRIVRIAGVAFLVIGLAFLGIEYAA